MRTTFLKGAKSGAFTASKSLSDLCKDLQTRVTDASIEPLLRRNASELDPALCVNLLEALSKVSKRGRVLKTQKSVLERAPEWERLVERCTAQVLENSSNVTFTPKQYISLCTSMSQLRIGESEKLARLFPKDNDYAVVHLLRHAANCNDPAFVNEKLDWVLLHHVLSKVNENRRETVWVIPHVCLSLAMTLAGDVEPRLALLEHNKTIWKSAEVLEKVFDERMWDDLSQASVALNPDDVSSDMYARLKTRGMHVNDTRIVSKFQTEVCALISRLDKDGKYAVTHETPEGVDIILKRKSDGRVTAIQCYGPTHYVWNQSRLEGRTKLRELMLKRWHGHNHIERLKATDWDRLSPSRRVSFIESLLR